MKIQSQQGLADWMCVDVLAREHNHLTVFGALQ